MSKTNNNESFFSYFNIFGTTEEKINNNSKFQKKNEKPGIITKVK
jgi:hypothetical protein